MALNGLSGKLMEMERGIASFIMVEKDLTDRGADGHGHRHVVYNLRHLIWLDYGEGNLVSAGISGCGGWINSLPFAPLA